MFEIALNSSDTRATGIVIILPKFRDSSLSRRCLRLPGSQLSLRLHELKMFRILAQETYLRQYNSRKKRSKMTDETAKATDIM